MADFTKQKKVIMPFFDRASQCESVAPIAAYYTRYAGMLKGLDFKPHIHPDIEAVLFTMLSKLEQDKKKMGLATSAESDAAKKADEEDELRAFALKVFAIADRTDQMGARDGKLLNKYMSARTFLQAYETILDERPLPQKEAELLKYCSVRCYQISKALKAGEPVPAPPASPGEPDEAATPAEDAALDQELARLEADDAERSAAAVAASAAASSRPPPLPPAEASSSGLSGVPSFDHAQMPTPPVAQAAPPPPRLPSFFQQGAHILYRKDINHMLQHGRIIRASGGTATITTVSSTAEATAEELAPYLPSGSEVMLKPPSSSPRGLKRMETMGGSIDPSRLVPATVLHDDSETNWPPNYTVRMPDASTAVVSHYEFAAVTLPPGSSASKKLSSDGGGAAACAATGSAESERLPSVPPALPGIPKQNFGLAADPNDPSRYPAPMDLPTAPEITPVQPPQPAAPAYAPAPQHAAPPPQPTAPPPPAYSQQPAAPVAAPAYSPPPAPATPVTAAPMGAPPTGASDAQKEQAKKHAKQAISAMNFDDIHSAVHSLRAALAALGVADPYPGAQPSATLAYKQRETVHRSAKGAMSSMNFDDVSNAVNSLRTGLATLVGASA